jgi:hypothetical protein
MRDNMQTTQSREHFHAVFVIKCKRIQRKVVLFFLALLILLSGCDGRTIPDVRCQYRESLLGNGYVLIVTNSGGRPLFNVTVTCQKWQKRYIISHQLNPGDSAEAGWMQLPEGVRKGIQYEISAEGYLFPRYIHIE